MSTHYNNFHQFTACLLVSNSPLELNCNRILQYPVGACLKQKHVKVTITHQHCSVATKEWMALKTKLSKDKHCAKGKASGKEPCYG